MSRESGTWPFARPETPVAHRNVYRNGRFESGCLLLRAHLKSPNVRNFQQGGPVEDIACPPDTTNQCLLAINQGSDVSRRQNNFEVNIPGK